MLKRMIKALSKLGTVQINNVTVSNNSIANVSTSSGDVFIGFGGNSRSSIVRGNGKSVTIERSCEKFDKIRSDGPIDVKFVKSDSFYVKVTAESNIQDMIKTEVVGRDLRIGFKGNVSAKKAILVECGSQWLKEVTLTGAGSVDITRFVGRSLVLHVEGTGDISAAGEFDDITARVGGAGRIKIDPVIAESVDLIVDGAGEIFVEGVCSVVSAELDGAGYIKCGKLRATDAYLNVKGAGDIIARCKEKLTAIVEGAGDIRVKGSPSRVNKKVRGAGDIEIC